MSLVALDGTPLVMVGMAGRQGNAALSAMSNTFLDAAKEACIMIGQVFTADGGSHTIDTTGSSNLQWRSAAVTFANAGTTVKVGLAAVDTATGPPGRAVNVTDVITFDVSKSHTGGGGGITADAWQTNVPDAGTKTVANGDILAFAVQMTAVAGGDSVNVSTLSIATGVGIMPFVANYTGGSYAAPTTVPNALITFSDGTLGWFYGASVISTITAQTWNSGSGTKEYGNYLSLPVPVKVYGIIANCNVAGNTDFILYSDPLGTPVAEKTVSVDLNVIGASAADRWLPLLFASPYSATASQPLAAIIKPTSATTISSPYITMNASAHQNAWTGGTNVYAVNRASGAFAAQNSNKDRFTVGLLVGAFDDATGGGASAVQYRPRMSAL